MEKNKNETNEKKSSNLIKLISFWLIPIVCGLLLVFVIILMIVGMVRKHGMCEAHKSNTTKYQSMKIGDIKLDTDFIRTYHTQSLECDEPSMNRASMLEIIEKRTLIDVNVILKKE